MKKAISVLLVFVLTTLFSITSAYANNDIPNDRSNYMGDCIKFPVRINVSTEDNKNSYCIPADTSLECLGKADEEGNLWVKLNDRYSGWRGFVSLGLWKNKEKFYSCEEVTPKVENATATTETKNKEQKTANSKVEIPKDIALKVSKRDIELYSFDRYGFTYGALVVPYKYHFDGSKNFEGNSSVGPYFGWRLGKPSWFGLELKFVGFLGASAIKVNQNIDGNDSEQSLAGLSYGGGILGEIKKEFQLGFILGADKVSKSANYEDNEKLWGAISIGFSFSN